MKVGSLFAEIGFKVDENGSLKKFSASMKAFQDTIRSGLNDLRAYAKAAREISQAMREAYVPNQVEARSRFRAETANMRSQARLNNAWARRNRSESISNAADSYLKAQRARFFEQDSNTRAKNAESRKRALDQKERGLVGTHTGKYSSNMLSVLRAIAGHSFGGFIGGLAGLAGAAHPIVMAITAGVKIITSAIRWLGKTIREGMQVGLAYRDYMSFTGRGTQGIAGILAASLGTTSMKPSDVMKDISDLETSFWDMWFGGGNPRAWQMAGMLPTGHGETDLKNILSFVYSASDKFQNRGLAKSLLKQFGLNEEYIQLIENLVKNNPNQTLTELLSKTKEQISIIEKGNKVLREYDERMNQIKLKITEAIINSNLLDLLEKFADILAKIIEKVPSALGFETKEARQERREKKGKAESFLEDALYYANPILGSTRLFASAMSGDWGSNSLLRYVMGTNNNTTNNITSNVTNNTTVSSVDEAVKYNEESRQTSMNMAWWGRNLYNSSDRTATSTGEG